MISGRNRIGIVSLGAAFAGFLFVTFQPWLALDSVRIFRGLGLGGLLSAFFDASLVGALADWFAVTALFRNPMGVKLPHTDILARNKDAIAEAVPRFLTSFVSEERIADQLGAIDFGAKVEQLLSDSSTRGQINDFISQRLSTLLGSVLNSAGEPSEGFVAVVREIVKLVEARIDPARAAGALLPRFADADEDAGGHRYFRFTSQAQSLDAARRRFIGGTVVRHAGAAEAMREGIAENVDVLVDTITPLIKRNAGWQGLFVGRGTVERLLRGAQEELERVRADPRHDLRLLVGRRLEALSLRLSGDTEVGPGSRDGGSRDGAAGRLRASFRTLASDPATAGRISRFAAVVLERLRLALQSESPGFTDGVERIEDVFLTQLRENNDFRRAFNRGVTGLVSSLIARSGLIEGVTGYLAGLLKATDEREFVGRVEDAVWNDLQYIRFNGAVVGGIVGILLAVIAALIHK